MTAEPGPALVRVVPSGDAALVAQYAARLDPAVNAHATALAAGLRARWGTVLRDIVVGFCSVTAYFDPLSVDARWLEAEMLDLSVETEPAAPEPRAVVQVPVSYGGDDGPDLDTVAAYGGCSPDEVVELHSGCEYRVYMIGFVPGFPYMAQVDARIAAPRRPTPRETVPYGSVGIAGSQTGIYPASTPGGWNIIGRTSIRPYDLARTEPCLFRPGDRVRFVPTAADGQTRRE